MERIELYSDGGSRGNPGHSAFGFCAVGGGEIVFKDSGYLGINTNNYAEYMGLINALLWLNKNKQKFNQAVFYMDSELIVKQINGKYKVKSKKLIPLFLKAKKMIEEYPHSISFFHVVRSFNSIADSLVNEELDRKMA